MLRNAYTDEYHQEAQAAKMQQRQQDLANIVNELGDSLIDVGLFSDTSRVGAGMANEEEGVRAMPRQYSSEELEAVVKRQAEIDEGTRKACRVAVSEPLYVKL